jgi:acetylornithine deacetylase
MNEDKSIKNSQVSRRSFVGGAGALALSSLSVPASAAVSVLSADALALAEDKRGELVDLLSGLVRVRSLSGETAADAQDVVKSYLANMPYRIDESADRPSRYTDHAEFMEPNPPSDGPFINVVAWPDEGRDSKFAMFSHIDTHIVADGWDTDPYEAKIVGNRMYGLGTSDDKGGVAAMLVAAAALADLGGNLPVVMSLHGKGGGSRGSLPVFERLRQAGQQMDGVLYVHPAETGRGLDDVKTEVKGVLDLELSVDGWRAPQMEIGSVDSAPWDKGGNAIDTCWKALQHLRGTVFSDVEVNLGEMNGGDRLGSVADAASARFRLKFGGDHTWKALLKSAKDELANFAGSLPTRDGTYSIAVEPLAYRTNPGAADWDAPVSQVLRNSITEITGKAPAAYPNHYAGDIRYPIRLLGSLAYGIGSIGGNFYGPNEWVDIDDLVRLVAVLIQTASGWSEL